MIISCDLPNEADVDCNGISGGTALVDSCGVCSEGNTGLTANADITECGDCFDYSCYEYQCNDSQAINYHEVSGPELIDNSLCIYDICTDYLDENNDFVCNSEVTAPYALNEELGCDALEAEFSMCYPEDCSTSFKLADFEDKIIWIIYEADWWTACYAGTPQLEEVIIEYIDNPYVAIINVLDDPPGGYYCEQWGINGDDRIPIIVNDYSYNGEVRSWFNFSQWSMPQYIFIDQDFKYHAITQTESIAEDILEELLENLEGE